MFYPIQKLENRVNELDRLRYRDIRGIDSFNLYEPQQGKENIFPEGYSDQKMKVNDTWSGRDKYLWLNTFLSIPEEWRGKKAVLYLDLGRTGGGNNSGFESLLYVNEKPFQGVDSNHKEVILPAEDSLDISIQLWSGLEGGGQPANQYYRLKEAWWGYLDEKVDDLYFKSKAILDSIKQQDEHDPNRSIVLAILNRTFHEIDWSDSGSETFYQSLYAARSVLLHEMENLPKYSDVTIHATGHSHIDLAWLWRTKHTKEKARRTFYTVLRLMELYPDYTFLQSQPQLYEWVKEEDPELFAAIKAKVADGQWEVEGSMWVEADCNIPSGESFVRQLLYGKRFFEKEFNKKTRTLWLPDVFGYSWSLPQILRKSGIDTFMTTKISWNQYNRMPHDTFQWRGIDGSEILTHFITTPEPGRPADSWFYTYNGLITAETVKGIWEKYRDKDLNKELLLAYGYGDGGGGVNREMIEMKRHLDTVPSMPSVKSVNAHDYFEKLHDTVGKSDQYTHTWDGELYLEYHRGTYTSHAKMKEMNRKLEYGYREAELLSSWNSAVNGWDHYPQELLEKGWKMILLNQFHDIIPGSSITEVYEDAHQDYEKASGIKETIITSQENYIFDGDKHWSFLHPHQYTSSVLVTVPESNGVYEMDGIEVETQTLSNGDTLVLVPETKPFSYHTISMAEKGEKEKRMLSNIDLNERRWETPFYRIRWNTDGHITSLFDKEEGREMIQAGATGNVLKLYEDKPLAHDAWDIDLYYVEKSTPIDLLEECTILENGPLKTTVAFTWKTPQMEIFQRIHCYSHTKRIDFETDINWSARQQLLKVEFPVSIRSTEAIYDIQFGNVKRPTHWNTSWDMARFESVGHKWVALTEPYYGISLMNDSKYGYSIKDNVLGLSLLKGPVYPDPKADIGHHHFVYSLYPFAGQTSKQDIEREATYLNAPLRIVRGETQSGFQEPLLSISGHGVIIDTVKKAEDRESLIVRLHEMEGARSSVTITSSLPLEAWREINLMEDESISDFNEGPICLTFNPYEIKTIELIIKEQNAEGPYWTEPGL
ncbi:alpha-mannosidase [Rossellomorea aquimaris]|nr:alpha-mannosidase [Rossellomorea aquimaris]WRP06278.1 alpha-mannosidase [Rossellomorea aquimaris]